MKELEQLGAIDVARIEDVHPADVDPTDADTADVNFDHDKNNENEVTIV
jgi:hypothetical protein